MERKAWSQRFIHLPMNPEDSFTVEHVSEFKYLACVNEPGTDEAEYKRKVASGRRVADAIRSLANVRDLQLECASLA